MSAIVVTTVPASVRLGELEALFVGVCGGMILAVGRREPGVAVVEFADVHDA